MNRQMRRDFAKQTKDKLLRKRLTSKETFVFKDGVKVMLNYEKIMEAKKDKDKEYLQFVEDSKNTVFTIQNISYDKLHNMVTFVEYDRWSFHVSDLILAKVK